MAWEREETCKNSLNLIIPGSLFGDCKTREFLMISFDVVLEFPVLIAK